jgi:acetolactate synthase-1/3 small subunit
MYTDAGKPPMQHIFTAFLEDKPGVLSRVTALFSRRNYNIVSLTVGRTRVPGISRMTVVVETDPTSARLVEANLYKLVNVLRVEDVTHEPSVVREITLIKVNADIEARAKVLQLCEVFRARVVDLTPNALIVEATGGEQKIDGLLDVLEPFGITEVVRTGLVAMTRGPQTLNPNPQFVNAHVPATDREATNEAQSPRLSESGGASA